MNWTAAYNLLFKILNKKNSLSYHSGSAFIKVVQKFNPELPKYTLYIEERKAKRKSTTREDFYWDILKELDETIRLQVFYEFIKITESHAIDETQELKAYLSGNIQSVPVVSIPNNQWNADKLNKILQDIDNAINTGNFNYAVTLAYTCLEGLYKSYIAKHLPTNDTSELIPLAKLVRTDIEEKLSSQNIIFPDQIIKSITTLTNAIANSRNSFSDSHFDKDAHKWLALYIRDLVNSVARLVLHFL